MKDDARREMTKRSRRAFLWMGVVGAGMYGAWRWLVNSPKRNGLDSPLRSMLETNESIWSRYFDPDRRAPVFPASSARMPRRNGMIGLRSPLDRASYRLTVEFPSAKKVLTVEDVMAVGAVDLVTELCCIEGWSQIVKWTGVPLHELIEKVFGPDWIAQSDGYVNRYLYAETPDGEYYVSLNMESAVQAQTLVCWAMDGRPLEPDHGAPLRLVVPTKYGIKSLKRLGTIRFTNERPTDFWYERGYDWYAGI